MCFPFTCLVHSYWGIITKFEVKSRSIISAYLATTSMIYKNWHNYWHNFRNRQAMQVAYYATFSSTIYQSLLTPTPLPPTLPLDPLLQITSVNFRAENILFDNNVSLRIILWLSQLMQDAVNTIALNFSQHGTRVWKYEFVFHNLTINR